MKKKFDFIFAIVLIIICVVPIGIVAIIANEKKNTYIKDISNMDFDNLAEALNCYHGAYNNIHDEKIRDKLKNMLKEYIVDDINGNYYIYNDNYSKYKKSSNRFIYIKNSDEAYIIPFDDDELSVDNLDELKNIEQYKYKVINVDTDEALTSENEYNQVTVKFQNYLTINKTDDDASEYYKYIYLQYAAKDDYYIMKGFFSDTISDDDDFTSINAKNSNGYYYYNYYYRTKAELEAKLEKDKEARKEKEEEKEYLKKSIPKVGMTKDEVKQTKWGSPDRINKDTYAWGTTEQWVYDDYGYVYFRNGIVSSVSERYK